MTSLKTTEDYKKINELLIRRKSLVLVPHPSIYEAEFSLGPGQEIPNHLLASFNLNLQNLGYTLSPEVIFRMRSLALDAFLLLAYDILGILKEFRAVRNYHPMYPNFPRQVIEASDAELYINAILHYFSFAMVDATGDQSFIWLPKYAKDRREPLDEKVKLQVLHVARGAEPSEIASQLAGSNTSLSDTDKADLKFLYEEFLDRGLFGFPKDVPNKENLAFLGTVFFGGHLSCTFPYLSPHFKTATDVLRLAVALSDGDISLATPTKFRKFKRAERRELLALLDGCLKGYDYDDPDRRWSSVVPVAEDISRHEGAWLRLAERLHPGEYADRYHGAFDSIWMVRNSNLPQSWRSKVEEAVRSGNIKEAIELLVERPGEYARRLDQLLRVATTYEDKVKVAEAFLVVADKVSTPVLLQAKAHFEARSAGNCMEELPERTVFPKGNVAKVQLVPALPRLDEDGQEVCKLLPRGISSVLLHRFKTLPPLGKVYLDSKLQSYLLPFSQRSASKSLRTIVRGSCIPFYFYHKNILRAFLWWRQPGSPIKGREEARYNKSRTDLDLSIVFFSKKWEMLGRVAYYDLKNDYSWHSGDITSAPDGACEFIDIDISKAFKAGVRYAVMTVTGFTTQNFCDLPECFAGWMLREKAQKGEVFDPKTVEDKADLASETRSGIPVIFDLDKMESIWCDSALSIDRHSPVNVDNNKSAIELLCRAMSRTDKPSVYDLLYIHSVARGTFVNFPEDADTVFSVANGTQFDLGLASEFMTDNKTGPAEPSKVR